MFGVSAPLAKDLLGDVRPQLLAGLLYGGAAVALSGAMTLRRNSPEAGLRRGDALTMAVVTVTGGVVAPVLLLIGLDRVSGVAGSLLLNLEAVATMALALLVFGEHLGRRGVLGAAAVVAASALLGVYGSGGSSPRVEWLGIACIAGACLCWAIDNNLTQRLSDRDPFAIVRVKASVAGVVNLALAVGLGASRPPVQVLVAAVVLGGAAFGLSVVLDAYALRWVGAAREAAYFGTAPLFGVATAVVVLNEVVTVADAVSIVIMGVGIYLLITERHAHPHRHVPIHHDHRHRHDDGHHDHGHDGPDGEHSHGHGHETTSHAHAHVSDVHHRHAHGTDPSGEAPGGSGVEVDGGGHERSPREPG